LACLTRTQMLSLFVIFVAALLLDVARHGRSGWRARFAAWPRALWVLLGGGVAAMLLLFVVKPDLTTYAVLATHASIGKILSVAGHHAATAVLAFGLVSVVALFALMLDRASWRDERIGPLLVVVTASVLVMFPLLARFEAWATVGAPVERYSMYLAPLMAVV